MAALLAWAVRFRHCGRARRRRSSSSAPTCCCATSITQTNIGNAYLLLIGGPIVGFLCGSLQQMAAERDEAQRAAAAAAERARLARVVHDGVLQVLALVQRRGAELGGDGAELGRLAGEQESRLRTLIRTQDAAARRRRRPAPSTSPTPLARLRDCGPASTSRCPAGAVDLPAAVGSEVVAVVEACLDNVDRHVGEGAPAWVLLEAFGDRVEVSVRDDGPGIPEGRLERGRRRGPARRARVDPGPRSATSAAPPTLTTGSFGTEWEFSVPRTP